MSRAERLEALVSRAYARRRRRRALQVIARGFGRTERIEQWTAMHDEAERLAERLWEAWKQARWEAAKAATTPGYIIRYGNAHPLPKRPS